MQQAAGLPGAQLLRLPVVKDQTVLHVQGTTADSCSMATVNDAEL